MSSDDFRSNRADLASFFQMARLDVVDQGVDPNDIYEDDTRVARMEQFGDICCPPAGEFGILFTAGHGGVGLPLSSPTYKPKTQTADGKCYVGRGLYCDVKGTEVLLHNGTSKTPGRLELNSGTSAAGAQDVVVNAGKDAVARVGDLVDCGNLKISLTAGVPPAPGTMSMVYTDPDNNIFPTPSISILGLSVTAIINFPLRGRIKTGAPHFKG